MTKIRISEKAEPLNVVARNIRKIKREQAENIFDDLNSAYCIVLGGEGRSKGALDIGAGIDNKDVRTIFDIDFPGRDMLEAAPVLEKKYSKIALLVNSGSGETTTPKTMVEQLSNYIERKKTKKFTIDAIVSDKNSSIGKIGEKSYGNIVEIKGRRKQKNAKNTNESLKHGIMNDIYELGTLLFVQKIKEVINKGGKYKTVPKEINTELGLIGRTVDKFIESDMFENIINILESRSRITMGGLGPARNVANMTVIRLQHVKRAIGDEAYLSGASAPNLRARDILFLISWSGETEPLLQWCDTQKKVGGYIYSITGNESALSEKSDDCFIIDRPPEVFYMLATFILSPLPAYLVQRLHERGFDLPDYIIEWWHSKTE